MGPGLGPGGRGTTPDQRFTDRSIDRAIAYDAANDRLFAHSTPSIYIYDNASLANGMHATVFNRTLTDALAGPTGAPTLIHGGSILGLAVDTTRD